MIAFRFFLTIYILIYNIHMMIIIFVQWTSLLWDWLLLCFMNRGSLGGFDLALLDDWGSPDA